MDIHNYKTNKVRSLLAIDCEKEIKYQNSRINEASGFFDNGYYVVDFFYKGELIRRRYYKKSVYDKKIKSLQNQWIFNDILNRSGLATKIWDDSTPNKLRRRLEIKAERNTFTMNERKKILESVEEFRNQIIKSFPNDNI